MNNLDVDIPGGFSPVVLQDEEILDFDHLSGFLLPQQEIDEADVKDMLLDGAIVAKITDESREDFFQVFKFIDRQEEAELQAYLSGIDSYYDCELEEHIYLNF